LFNERRQLGLSTRERGGREGERASCSELYTECASRHPESHEKQELATEKQQRLIIEAIRSGGNQTQTADALGITVSQLAYHFKLESKAGRAGWMRLKEKHSPKKAKYVPRPHLQIDEPPKPGPGSDAAAQRAWELHLQRLRNRRYRIGRA
jgi:hypothetical protein